MKVALCIPHYGDFKAPFAVSVWNMVAATLLARIEMDGQRVIPEFGTFTVEDGPLDYKRTALVTKAREWGARFILFLDTDHTFPPDALLRLLSQHQAVIGTNYIKRRGPAEPSALKAPGTPLVTTRNKAEAREIEEVRGIGLGLCLLEGRIFDRIPEPWFKTTFCADGLLMSEDMHFCEQARAAGLSIYVDHALSWEVGHISQVVRMNEDMPTADVSHT